jgi:hypothetical protein
MRQSETKSWGNICTGVSIFFSENLFHVKYTRSILPLSEEQTREFSIMVAVSLATLILYTLDISTTLAVVGAVVSTKMGPENA